jgi:hypothetical protein
MDHEPVRAPAMALTCGFPTVLHSPSRPRIPPKRPVTEFTRQRSHVRYLLRPQFISGGRAGRAVPSWRAGSRKASARLATAALTLSSATSRASRLKGQQRATGHLDAPSSWRVAVQCSRVRPTPRMPTRWNLRWQLASLTRTSLYKADSEAARFQRPWASVTGNGPRVGNPLDFRVRPVPGSHGVVADRGRPG